MLLAAAAAEASAGTFTGFMNHVAEGFEALGAAILVVGVVWSFILAAVTARRSGAAGKAYRVLRQAFGGTLLLGLEILVAADLVRTVAVAPTLDNVLVLGLIVVIRTFLSFSLETEIEGTVPWRRARVGGAETIRRATATALDRETPPDVKLDGSLALSFRLERPARGTCALAGCIACRCGWCRERRGAMEIKMVLYLPRDAVSVPVSRQVLDSCLETLGVTPDTRADIALALSEACANVIQHAGAGEEYEVQVSAKNCRCAIEVVNAGRRDTAPVLDFSGAADDRDGRGAGWDQPDGFALADDPVSALSEHGRGLKIIDAVTDNLQLTSNQRQGTTLHFEKTLEWLPGAAGPHLFNASGSS